MPSLKSLLNYFDAKCSVCGVNSRIADLEIDHITPLFRGGEDITENIRILCYNHHRLRHTPKNRRGKLSSEEREIWRLLNNGNVKYSPSLTFVTSSNKE